MTTQPDLQTVLRQFYQSAVFLEALGQARGEPVSESAAKAQRPDHNNSPKRERRILDWLTDLFDKEKNGRTVTAIGRSYFENNPERPTFWVAVNESSLEDEIVRELQKVLRDVADISDLDKGDRRESLREEFLRARVNFVDKRVIIEIERLLDAIRNLTTAHDPGDIPLPENLSELLRDFSTRPTTAASQRWELCRDAYDEWRDERLGLEQLRSQRELVIEEHKRLFDNVEHFIDRLANHVRAPMELIEFADEYKDIRQLFKTADVRKVRNGKAMDVPPLGSFALGKVALDGVARGGLHQLRSLWAQVSDRWHTLNPMIHAEIRVLEHLLDLKGQKYVPYVGCSKPACFCCFHYIKARGFDPPRSSLKIYPDWGVSETWSDLCPVLRSMTDKFVDNMQTTRLQVRWDSQNSPARPPHVSMSVVSPGRYPRPPEVGWTTVGRDGPGRRGRRGQRGRQPGRLPPSTADHS